ncbi:hypothetical protein [Bradyrhizobium cenepequi]
MNYLKPSETLSELFAGLVVVLTVTLAASVLGGGDEAGATTALIGAIGANTAWGIIDASLYVMNATFDRKRQLRFVHVIAASPDEATALDQIRGELDPILESVTKAGDRDQLYRSIYSTLAHGEFPARSGLQRDDIVGAIQMFCIALCATLPAAIPLLLSSHPMQALRISNFLVVGLLFIVGYYWAKYVDVNRWFAGLGLMSLGLILVGVAIALGG